MVAFLEKKHGGPQKFDVTYMSATRIDVPKKETATTGQLFNPNFM
jgi:hypothetical protein